MYVTDSVDEILPRQWLEQEKKKDHFKQCIHFLLPEDSDRKGCTLPSALSFMWGHAGSADTNAGSQVAHLGKSEEEKSYTCEEKERSNPNNEVMGRLEENSNPGKH